MRWAFDLSEQAPPWLVAVANEWSASRSGPDGGDSLPIEARHPIANRIRRYAVPT
jgi:hypothetical protein